ncbi:MAG: hypothetical protein KKE53_20815, partial [Proteobacteria bacterium]|nr:hypothetical protein [Pseudomonadota bacterium]
MAYFSARITCSLLSVLMIFSLLLPSIGKAAVGNPLTASIELADGSHDAGFMENASVTELANGNFVAVWETRVNTDTTPATSFDGDGDGVFYQMFNSSGAALGSVVTASTTTVLDQESPLAAALADGGFVITWAHETVAADADIDARMRVFDNSGIALTSDIDVNESEPTGTID